MGIAPYLFIGSSSALRHPSLSSYTCHELACDISDVTCTVSINDRDSLNQDSHGAFESRWASLLLALQPFLFIMTMIKTRIPQAVVVLLSLCSLLTQVARADTWQLPEQLTDSNTRVTFVVDSTFHTVHGTTKNISGLAKLVDKRDPLSIHVNLSIPVSLFNTDSESRDERLREVMAANLFAHVAFTATRLSENCAPEKITATTPCQGEMKGLLTIRDVTKEVRLPTTISKTLDFYTIKGDLPITWSEYNVEDPSILIARLDPTVTIFYETHIPVTH